MTQFEMCPFRPEEHGTERPLQNRNVLLIAGIVEAARFLGGQTVAALSLLESSGPAILLLWA